MSISTVSSFNWGPSYDNLPMEITTQIFSYLNHADLQAAGSTCKRWQEALYNQKLNDRTVVRFVKVHLSDKLLPATIFIQGERPFRHFIFEDVTFGETKHLMQRISKSAIDVTFDNVDIGEKQFYYIIEHFSRLQSLNIIHCSPLFMSGKFLGNEKDREQVAPAFSTIRHLSLCHNQYMSDAILLRIVEVMKRIESLNMDGCHIAYHNAIYKRFYPKDKVFNPSESILTFKLVKNIIEQHQTELRELNLSSTMIGAQALLMLCEPEFKDFKLLRLHLAKCLQMNVSTVTSFLITQPQLTVLDLSSCPFVNDNCIKSIVASNQLLEDLNLSSCTGITNTGIAIVAELKKLRCLNISYCEGISSEGITQGIAQSRNEVLQELQMSNLKMCCEGIKCIAKNLPQLRVLNVNHCVNGVVDESLNIIIQNLRWLRVLMLEGCKKITDSALTGINIFENDTSTSSVSQTLEQSQQEELLSNCSNYGMKISLRSKAEDEIVADANRKKTMLAAAGKINAIGDIKIEGCTLRNLNGLRVLNLKDCNKITDVSLKYGMLLPELQQLSLSNCQQITHLGLEALAENCTSMEDIDLRDCYNVNDVAIKIITCKLTRLRTLHVSGCNQLTDHSLDAILVNCSCLQTLSIQRCRQIHTDIEERLAGLSSLRHLYIDYART